MTENSKSYRRTVEFKTGARNLFFHILTACNLSCRHCYINREQHGNNILSIEEIDAWLRQFHGGREKETNVIFLGGEPTMHPQLPEAVRAARKLGYSSITIDTNGFLFHDFLNRLSPNELDYLSFSLDGSCPEVNDPIRGKGVFDVCTRNIRRAVQAGVAVSSIFTVSRMNLHDLPNMPALLHELMVRRFFIQVVGIRGNSGKMGKSVQGAGLQVERKEWENVVPEVARHAASLGIHVTFPKVFLDADEPFQCAGLVADNYFVFPNGRVYRCPLCEDYAMHSMEMRDGVLHERPPITERELFPLNIREGCVFNRILQPGNISYDAEGCPVNKIACCMLKEEIVPGLE
ncbi:MAG: radical SAM protein [Dissulfuribacterales bacterium]